MEGEAMLYSTQTHRRWVRPSIAVIVVAILALAGTVLVLLPSAAGWFSQAMYSQQIIELAQSARTIEPDSRAAAIAAAREYNQQLVAGARGGTIAAGAATIGANQNVPTAEADDGDAVYGDLLSADSRGLMARIRVPSISVDLPIYHGTTDDVLAQGVGHLHGTALPVGGESTHSVLTAHRGLATAELFTHLDRVEIGDTFTIEVFGEVLTYRVFETRVVEPDQTESLFPQRGRDLVTLVTCTPLGINTHRILVTAERITPTPIADLAAVGQAPQVPGFPWWALGFAGAITAVGIYVIANSRTGQRKDRVDHRVL